jgi:hypothetical protein
VGWFIPPLCSQGHLASQSEAEQIQNQTCIQHREREMGGGGRGREGGREGERPVLQVPRPFVFFPRVPTANPQTDTSADLFTINRLFHTNTKAHEVFDVQFAS